MKKSIEIEFRSIFSKAKYLNLKRYLNSRAKFLGQDDKDVYFFLFPNKLLKVVRNVSKRNAAVVLKLNKIGHGSDFEEIEIPITRNDVQKWVNLFKLLGFRDVMHSYQKRQNFVYKGVEIALKHSKIWGYHIELEVLLKKPSEKLTTERRIKNIAHELGISLMSDKELKKFTKDAELKYGIRK